MNTHTEDPAAQRWGGSWDTRPGDWPWQQVQSANTVTVACRDTGTGNPGCTGTLEVYAQDDAKTVTLAAARAVAAAQGWRQDHRGFDVCPSCALLTPARTLRPRGTPALRPLAPSSTRRPQPSFTPRTDVPAPALT